MNKPTETPESLRELAKNKETIANMKFPFLSKMLTKEAADLRARADEMDRGQSHTHGPAQRCDTRCSAHAATAEQERFYAPLIERSTTEQAGKPTAEEHTYSFAQKDALIARLKEELAASESTLKFACHEWAKDNTSIRAIAEQFGIVTDDKSGYFIPRKQVMQELADKFTSLTRERDALLVALEKCADDIDAWSTVLADEWPNFDGQLYPASNAARAAIANVKK